jgi:hypothetical protein
MPVRVGATFSLPRFAMRWYFIVTELMFSNLIFDVWEVVGAFVQYTWFSITHFALGGSHMRQFHVTFPDVPVHVAGTSANVTLDWTFRVQHM